MAYGRYDRGREPRPTRSAWDDDRAQRFSDERGFFERAGDEISSWFGEDDSQRRRDSDEAGYEQGARFRDEGYRRPYTGRWASPPDRGRRDYGDGYQPMTGDYGRAATRDRSAERSQDRAQDRASFSGMASTATHAHDRHYGDWRQRQIDDLDRDYDEYRRENQSRFESDFSNWRATRQSKREMLGSIAPQMQVVGSDDQPVGTVDKVRGDRIVLTKGDSPDAHHHSIGCGLIDRVDGDRVILDKKADEAKASWGSEERDRALFERDEEREPGAHILERSFSGTY